jgi:CDP-diacylglycerol--glycerol-3-phosphate 3-phosphatidyltransferase
MSEVAARGFGPSALVTPANGLTVARVLLTPVLVGLILVAGPSYAAVAVGSLLAATDIVDGWVARRMGTTRSGAFLDPLADKFLVLGSLTALVVRGELWWVPVALIAGRELLISGYRTAVGRRGVSVPARASAKLKTLVQDAAVGFAILPPLAPRHLAVAGATLWVAVVLSWWTAGQYLLAGRQRVPGA